MQTGHRLLNYAMAALCHEVAMPVVSDRQPRWTWWLPLPLFQLGTWLSLSTQFSSGVAIWYVPFALGLAFSLWWGPRILPALFLNALLSVPLWDLDWHWAPLHALPETLAVGLGWLMTARRGFDPTLNEFNHLLRFILLGVLLPSSVVALGVQGNLVITGHLPGGDWLHASLALGLADSLSVLAIALPLLHFGTPLLRRKGWLRAVPGSAATVDGPIPQHLPPWPLLLVLLVGLPGLLVALPWLQTLPLIGFAMLVLSLVWGFPGALCGAVLTSLLVLALPLVVPLETQPDWFGPQRTSLHLSVLLMMIAMLLVGRSLSDMRRALARSARMQQQLALANLALEASPLGVSIADARAEGLPLIYCNPAFQRISGYSRAETLGQPSDFLLGRDQGQHELPRMQHARNRGETCQVVLRNYRKDGRPFWNEVTVAPMRDERGISHFLSLQHDVTSRERLAQELARRREELLRQTHLLTQTETIADLGGWVLELPGYRMFWSEGSYRIFEREPGDGALEYRQALAYLDDDSRELAWTTLRELFKGQDSFDIELHLSTARGNPRWVRARGLVERDGERVIRIYGALQDLTARKQAERQLQERDERLRLFFEAPLIGMALTTPEQRWEEVNYKLCSILGRSREELNATTWAAITHPDDLPADQARLEELQDGSRDGYELEKRFLRPDGSPVYTRVSVRAVRDADGRLEACLTLVEDISDRYEAEARYRTLVEHAPEAILVFDTERGIVEANENAARLFGLPREQLLGKRPAHFSPVLQGGGESSEEVASRHIEAALAGEAPVFDWLVRDAAGRVRPCEARLVRLPGGEGRLVRLSFTDISERQRYQREIERLAYSDELTGLPNRRLLLDRLQHAMAREQREGRYGALLFIDLDHFKTVNDSLGHPVGDGLLREVTARLAGGLRAEDTLARLGGDEFVVLLEAMADTPDVAAEHAAEVGEKLLASLIGGYRIDGHELSISASIGISLHPLGGQAAADVLKQADTAMYRAKQGGRNALHFFAPEMQAAIDQRLQLQNELRQAMTRGQLRLVFQPQLSLASGRVAGAEVLVRWSHPERGEVTPTHFIALAEETGMIHELGNWVLEQACATLARWQAQWPELVLAVNISPRELRQPDFAQRISSCLQRHGVPAAALELEITEGVLLEDAEQCIAAMQALKRLGVRFAIDDFGTGYSSLTYLKRLPLDRLKIDRSFVGDLDGETSGAMLVETILVIARNLGLECVAEGIESQVQLDSLRRHGCALGQGFHFSRPLNEPAFLAWMDARESHIA